MPKQFNITLEENYNAAPGDIETIERGLFKANEARIGHAKNKDFLRVTVTAQNETGEIIGGVYGEIYWNWLHGKALWVSEDYQKLGLGAKLLQSLENMAKAKGLGGLHLETSGFQALDFYLKYGYEVFGQLENKPQGYTWYYLKKEFAKQD